MTTAQEYRGSPRRADPATAPEPSAFLRSPRSRGRHRRPRPRKVLFAAGGLALAAGALSLIRLTPDAGVGGVDTAEAGPRLEPTAHSTDVTNTAAASLPTHPEATPTAPAAMGGTDASPTPPAGSVIPTPTAFPTSAVRTPSGPYTPRTPDARPTPAPTASQGAAAPTPTPTRPSAPAPGPSTASPAPGPEIPGLCVPVIGLCVDPLTAPAHR
ncbi:hypothetical protein ACIHAR_31720 [Streptomyces sp. NPDC052016]|uniref:hypothetical protein n=1 Tax=Streptomyces sp. NPDC052016 TaxID=3365680 RepID=UPI0037D892E1